MSQLWISSNFWMKLFSYLFMSKRDVNMMSTWHSLLGWFFVEKKMDIWWGQYPKVGWIFVCGKTPYLLDVNKHEEYKKNYFVGKYNWQSWKKLKSKDTFVFWENNNPHSTKKYMKNKDKFVGKNIIPWSQKITWKLWMMFFNGNKIYGIYLEGLKNKILKIIIYK